MATAISRATGDGKDGNGVDGAESGGLPAAATFALGVNTLKGPPLKRNDRRFRSLAGALWISPSRLLIHSENGCENDWETGASDEFAAGIAPAEELGRTDLSSAG